MAKSINTLMEEIMKECAKNGEPVSKEEAFEMAKMELGAKEVKSYVATEKVKQKAKSPRKGRTDTDKTTLIDYIYKGLFIRTDLDNLAVANPQTEVTFTYNGSEYSVKLVKHRPPKAE